MYIFIYITYIYIYYIYILHIYVYIYTIHIYAFYIHTYREPFVIKKRDVVYMSIAFECIC